jgi:predicted SAM-dependent methyltransferase
MAWGTRIYNKCLSNIIHTLILGKQLYLYLNSQINEMIKNLLKESPKFYRFLKRVRYFNRSIWGQYKLWILTKYRSHLRIVIGSSGIYDDDWIPTEIEFLNILKKDHWERYFRQNSIDAILAEHVWEHLTPEDAKIAAQFCFGYIKPGGYLRIAVPDGFHPNKDYIDQVKVGGIGEGADDHKVLYYYHTIAELFINIGFDVILLEFFDEDGIFHIEDWDPQGGTIVRSLRFDKRNDCGRLMYTSIILDAIKH